MWENFCKSLQVELNCIGVLEKDWIEVWIGGGKTIGDSVVWVLLFSAPATPHSLPAVI